jgi:hypothetical protein
MSPERREKEFMSAVKEISSDDLSAFFDTMYRLNSMTRYKIYRYGKTGKWKYYTYLNNYLLPPLDAFCKLLQKQLTARIPDFEAKLQKRKARIDREVVRYYYLLEMEEFRKDFYY